MIDEVEGYEDISSLLNVIPKAVPDSVTVDLSWYEAQSVAPTSPSNYFERIYLANNPAAIVGAGPGPTAVGHDDYKQFYGEWIVLQSEIECTWAVMQMYGSAAPTQFMPINCFLNTYSGPAPPVQFDALGGNQHSDHDVFNGLAQVGRVSGSYLASEHWSVRNVLDCPELVGTDGTIPDRIAYYSTHAFPPPSTSC